MVELSTHFTTEEFDMDGPIPAECLPIFVRLCQEIMEPAREQFGVPFAITSGYRSIEANAEAHGQPNSEHLATKDWCACDFLVSTGVRPIFDWMRTNKVLPFHQLILEHGTNGSTIIHVSINSLKPGVRSVLEGATHNTSPYIKVDHVEFAPIQPADLGLQGDV
jgi:hypothetical protein